MSRFRSFLPAATQRLTATLRTGGGLIAASMLTNLINFLYSAYLGRVSGYEEFGLISLINSFISLSQIPLSAYSRTIAHRTAFLFGKYKTPAKPLWTHLRGTVLRPSLAVTGIWLVMIPLIAAFFRTEQLLPFLLFTPIWSIGVAAAIDSGFLTGSMRFNIVAIMMIAEVAVKFGVTVLLVQLGLAPYLYVAIPLGALTSFVIGWAIATRIPAQDVKARDFLKFSLPKRFYASTVLAKMSTVAFLNLDVMLAKHYLSPREAGQYAILALVGKMIFFVGALFTQFMNPLVSQSLGAGKNPRPIFRLIMLLTVLAVSAGVLFVGVFGWYTVPLLLGEKTRDIVPFLLPYSVSMACLAVATGIVVYHQSRHAHMFAVATFLLSLGMLGGILAGHDSVGTINAVVTVGGVLYLAVTLFLHRFDEAVYSICRNLLDFFGLFTTVTTPKGGDAALRILMFNWRDTRHVWAGGAEQYIHQIAKRWVAEGHKVTVFCGNDTKCPRNEVIDGVQMVRRGGFYMVYVWALLYYVFRFRGNFDVVVDSENGIPFFTPLFVRVPKILLIHHVHQDVFRANLWYPLAMLATFLETKCMPFLYRHVPVITVSQSSKQELNRIGIGDARILPIVHPGIETHRYSAHLKTAEPSVLYLGRLRPYKNVDVLLKAFGEVLKHVPEARLTIAGEGVSKRSLEHLTEQLGIRHAVRFAGRVSEERKIELLGAHWVMAQPSSIEGWGITVIEANACGTPVIASNVNGLRDSVVDGKTGLLVPAGDVPAWAQALTRVITDAHHRTELTNGALSWASYFDWDASADIFLRAVQKVVEERRGVPTAKRVRLDEAVSQG